MYVCKNRFIFPLVASSLLFAACSETGGAGAEVPDTPDGTIITVASEMSKGNVGILWEAMPASYQQDLTTISHDFGAKVDADLYDSGFELIARVGELIANKKDFILNSPMAQQGLNENGEESIVAVSKAIAILANSELATAEGLRALDIRKLLDSSGRDLVKHLDTVAVAAGEDSFLQRMVGVTAEVVESGADSATLKVSAPGEDPQTFTLTRIEGKWVPVEIASEWESQMAEAKAAIAAITPEQMAEGKPQAMMMMGMVGGVLDQLDAASTQEEFDVALQGAMAPFMMMLGGAMGGGGGPMMPPAGIPPGSGTGPAMPVPAE